MEKAHDYESNTPLLSQQSNNQYDDKTVPLKPLPPIKSSGPSSGLSSCPSSAPTSTASTTCPTYCENNKISRPYQSSLIIDTKVYNKVIESVRSFFISKGFLEVSTQNRLSILAACEDPFNVGTFNYAGECWPLPQTGQMWLEYELLKNPEPNGYFCLTTSYRMEKNPKEGRHDLIFPLFEFEMKGGMDALIELEKDLLISLGYNSSSFIEESYENLGKLYNVKELEHEHEQKLYDELSPTFFIKDFPEFTSPFWNMKRDPQTNTSNKVDVILSGQETIGSAERETSKIIMKERFNSIMDGAYKDKIYELFGKDRTDKEMDDYLDFDMFKRCGGGIGITRLIRSMKLEGLIATESSTI
jgi:aspartyl/asparaginyl-tRNA synthetase